jgi:hypothetical protein
MGVSALEHSRSLKPSALVQTFLFFSSIFNAAQVRTQWLLSDDTSQSQILPALVSVILGFKLVILALESLRKAEHAIEPAEDVSKEEESGIFGRSLLLWVNPLLKLGYRKDLTVNDMFALDSSLKSGYVFERLSRNWGKSEYSSPAVEFILTGHSGSEDEARTCSGSLEDFPYSTFHLLHPSSRMCRAQSRSAVPRADNNHIRPGPRSAAYRVRIWTDLRVRTHLHRNRCEDSLYFYKYERQS